VVLAEGLSPTHGNLQPLIHRDSHPKLVVLMVFVRDSSRLNVIMINSAKETWILYSFFEDIASK